MININYLRYKKFLPIVIYTVFSLIFIGSVVRSTGSGMGCPDWPTCFGKLIPPTHISELPADYKTIFKVGDREIADFSAFKTWVEYTNRLSGVWTGIASLILSFLAFKIRKSHKPLFIISQTSLFLVILNGWLGSKVVSTHLMPGVITAHMLLAMLLVFFLLKAKHLVKDYLVKGNEEIGKFAKTSVILAVLLFIQVLLGTQVREQIDFITNHNPELERQYWVNALDYVFFIHRSFSIIIIIGYFNLLKKIIFKFKYNDYLQKISRRLMLVIIAEITAGIVLVYFKFPAPMQSLHLIFSFLMIGYAFEIALIFVMSKKAKVAV